jgi:2-hydroxycyclohexanecarboxyl-CoA dehydrogenase
MRCLKDRVVLVTGAAGGMGREICARFLDEGSTVAAFDVNVDGLKKLVERAEVEARLRTDVVDISDYDAVCRAVDKVEAAVGPIDVLVNNAGWDRFTNFLDADEALRTQVVSINLMGPINMMHAVLNRMARRQKGCVVTIASDAGRVGSSGQAVYSA